MKKLLVIVGPNASGKSSLSVALAQQLNGEIISADSRQVYRGLDIATGKVTTEEMGGVPHHLLDVVDPHTVYTAADFSRDGRKVLDEIFVRGTLPIVVGGTGFYIDALLNPELLAAVPPNPALRATLEKQSIEELFARLTVVDPKRAEDLRKKNEHTLKRRVIRALEIAQDGTTSQSPLVSPPPPFETLWLGIHWPDEILKKRIHERTRARLKSGMIEEAEHLYSTGVSWERMEELGLEYAHLADYLRGNISQEELVNRIDRDDWRYAKRQRTWFKRNPHIHWLEGADRNRALELARTFLHA